MQASENPSYTFEKLCLVMIYRTVIVMKIIISCAAMHALGKSPLNALCIKDLSTLWLISSYCLSCLLYFAAFFVPLSLKQSARWQGLSRLHTATSKLLPWIFQALNVTSLVMLEYPILHLAFCMKNSSHSLWALVHRYHETRGTWGFQSRHCVWRSNSMQLSIYT